MKTCSQQWTELKENSVNMYANATNYISEFHPLIKYLEKLTVEADSGLLVRFPVKHMISQDYQKLNALKIKVINITADIENLINTGQGLSLINKDMVFKETSDQLNTLTYLSGLNETFLFKNYGAALRDNQNISSFEGFTQSCRDSLMRLKFRTLGEDPLAPVNIRWDPQSIDSVELESLIKAMEQKLGLTQTKTTEFEQS